MWYSKTINETLEGLASSRNGLSSEEAGTRLEKYGYNELQKEKKTNLFVLFISQFKNALLMLLVFAGILSLFLGEAVESTAIFIILLLNAILGFVQEYKAEKAIDALKKNGCSNSEGFA